MSPGQRPVIETNLPHTCTCRRCGEVTPILGTDKDCTSPYCLRCRTNEELRRDLGCDGACTKKAPLCLEAPTGFRCPKGIYSATLMKVELEEVVDLIRMAGLRYEIAKATHGNGIYVTVSGFRNAGDIFTLEGEETEGS